MTPSNASSAILLALTLVTGGLGFLAGRTGASPAMTAPTVMTTAAPSGAAIQYVPQLGTLYVVKDAHIYRLDAKTLNILDGNILDWSSVPYAFRKRREADVRAALADDQRDAERARREREAEMNAAIKNP